MPRPNYTCGLEFSTQSAKYGFLDLNTKEFITGSFDYDAEFGGKYPIEKGVIRGDNDVVVAPQLMFYEALDTVFRNAPKELVENTRVYKVDAMQHNQQFTRNLGHGLRHMNPRKSIAKNLGGYLTRKETPIWEDRSTGTEVQYLNENFNMVLETANPAEPRFPAAQLIKWIREHPEEFKKTTEIRALSAGMTSPIVGKVVDTDTGDGWGTNMNTTNMNNPAYHRKITDFIHPDLYKKLGQMIQYDARVGNVSPYMVKRFGADPKAWALAATGDNPSYLLDFFLSAGSSWTLNGQLPEIIVSTGENNVFGCRPGSALSLICFTNGGKLHEEFRNTYANGSWKKYRSLPKGVTPGKYLMLPYQQAESVPRRKKGIVRDGFDASKPKINVRALYDSMVLAAATHSDHKLPDKIFVLAGGGKDPTLLQTVADVFDRPTTTLKHAKFAAVLGNAMAGAADYLNISYQQAIREYAEELPGSAKNPIQKNVGLYKKARKRFQELEKRAA